MSYPELEVLTGHVSEIFRIDDVTSGNGRELLVRYRGQLLGDDTMAAYDQLADALRPHGITPLFRKEDAKHVILLVPSPVLPGTSRRIWINGVLFILTIFSMLLTGAEIPASAVGPDGGFPWLYAIQHIFTGWPFAASMMAILLTHEMGHYIACRIYKVPATLPFFLPFPGLFGTLGAFIMMRGIPKNKRIHFDIGVAGPLAGLVVTVPLLFLGLSISNMTVIGGPGTLEGNSLFYLFAKYMVFGRLLPDPASMHGLPPLLYWILYYLTGHPIPIGGADVQLSPVAWAAWGGLLVTMLNLVPVGTLDGGHVVHGLFGEKARKLFPIVVGTLITLMILPVVTTLSLSAFNMGWLLWVAILFWLGNMRITPLDDITELDPKRRMLGFIVLIIFILIFTPVPLVGY